MGVENKVVAITGASSGIGRATALLLASRQAAVVLGARREDRLKTVADEIVKAGGRVVYRPIPTSSDDRTFKVWWTSRASGMDASTF